MKNDKIKRKSETNNDNDSNGKTEMPKCDLCFSSEKDAKPVPARPCSNCLNDLLAKIAIQESENKHNYIGGVFPKTIRLLQEDIIKTKSEMKSGDMTTPLE